MCANYQIKYFKISLESAQATLYEKKNSLYLWGKCWLDLFLLFPNSGQCFLFCSLQIVAMELISILTLVKRSQVTKYNGKYLSGWSHICLDTKRQSFITCKILKIGCSEMLISFIFSDEPQFHPEVCYFLLLHFLCPETLSTSNALVCN